LRYTVEQCRSPGDLEFVLSLYFHANCAAVVWVYKNGTASFGPRFCSLSNW